MKYHNRRGQAADEKHWLSVATMYGMGVALAETTLPHVLGDLTIRTVWLGVSAEDGSVKPYRTLRQIVGRSFTSLEEYDDEAGARAGHMRWVLRATEAT